MQEKVESVRDLRIHNQKDCRVRGESNELKCCWRYKYFSCEGEKNSYDKKHSTFLLCQCIIMITPKKAQMLKQSHKIRTRPVKGTDFLSYHLLVVPYNSQASCQRRLCSRILSGKLLHSQGWITRWNFSILFKFQQ